MSKVIKLFKKFRSLEVSSKVTKTLHGTYSSKMKTMFTQILIRKYPQWFTQKTKDSIGKWINRLWCIHAMKHNSETERNKLSTHTTQEWKN